MLQVIGGGNTFKFLKHIYKVKNGYISINTFKSTYGSNKVSLYIPLKSYKEFDSFNKIKTCNIANSIKKNVNYIHIKNFFKNSFIAIWTRIVFRGKGFRIRNFRKDLKLTFNFGHSHWDKVKFYKWWYFFKLRRQSYVVISLYVGIVRLFEQLLSTVKVVNRYTNRGLRIKRQPIIRRFGKISQVVSLLH